MELAVGILMVLNVTNKLGSFGIKVESRTAFYHFYGAFSLYGMS